MAKVVGRSILTEGKVKFMQQFLVFEYPDGSASTHSLNEVREMYHNASNHLVIVLKGNWFDIVVCTQVEVN